jgi:hypothetical protein
MLAVGFDRQRNVLLLTLLDTFDNGTLAVMDAACATFFDAEGPSAEAGRLLALGPLVFEPVDTSWLANDKAKVL